MTHYNYQVQINFFTLKTCQCSLILSIQKQQIFTSLLVHPPETCTTNTPIIHFVIFSKSSSEPTSSSVKPLRDVVLYENSFSKWRLFHPKQKAIDHVVILMWRSMAYLVCFFHVVYSSGIRFHVSIKDEFCCTCRRGNLYKCLESCIFPGIFHISI